MKRFTNILVAVDLSQGDRLVSDKLPPAGQDAVDRALWLAKLNGARIRFFHALDVSAAAQRLIEESGDGAESVLGEAKEILRCLVQRAASQGIAAELAVDFGKSWLEIIRQAVQHKHDLVLAGTRHLAAPQGVLMGSTVIKLLRKCPCPVWVTQPRGDVPIQSVLVAHCLREVGNIAMELGCSLAELQGAQLHVLHALEFPELELDLPAEVVSEKEEQYRTAAEKHITFQLADYDFAQLSEIHIVTDRPESAVLDYIERNGVELVVMGTISRPGLSGVITGSTAEQLLPQIPCSLLAVKPPDFVPVVSL